MIITNNMIRESLLEFLINKHRKFLKICALYEGCDETIKKCVLNIKNINMENSIESYENVDKLFLLIHEMLKCLDNIPPHQNFNFAINALKEMHQIIFFIKKTATKIFNEE